MKRGDRVLLKRNKRRISCEVIHDHSADEPPFPAMTIKRNGDSWIVGTHELVTAEELRAEREAERAKQEQTVADITEAFKAGNDSLRKLAAALGKQMVDILSRAKKAERLGLIKLVKEAK